MADSNSSGTSNWIISKTKGSGVKRVMQKSNKNGSSMGGKDQQHQQSKSTSTCNFTPIQQHHQGTELVGGDDDGGGHSNGEGRGGGLIGSISTESVGGEDNPSSSNSNSSSSSSSSSGSNGSRTSVWKSSPTKHHQTKIGGGIGVGTGRNKRRRHHSGGHHKPTLRHTSTTDTDENGSDISSSTLEREAPDGGWGWVVVGAAFFVNLIADGVTFSFGVFYSEFSDVFGESKSTTAWVGSLLAAMPLLSGPIASSLTDRFGCRKVTICGGLLAALGFFLSAYATSIYMLMLTFGVITGFGLSLCYVAAVVIVAYYFERRRSLATGLSVCGGGIGTFLFAPWSEYLIREYGWRGTTLILSGAFLNLCICGALMRDLEWTKKSSRKREKILQNEHDFNTQAQQNLLIHGDLAPHSLDGSASLAMKNERLCNSALCIPTFVQEQERRRSRRIRYFSTNYGDVSSIHSAGVPKSQVDPDHSEDDLIKRKSKLVNACSNNNERTKINSNPSETPNGTEKDTKDIVKEERDSSPRESVEERDRKPSVAFVHNGHIRRNSSPGTAEADNLIIFPSAANTTTSSNILTKTHQSNNSASNNNLSLTNNSTHNNPPALERNGSILHGEPTPQQKQLAMKNYVVHHTGRNWSGCHRHSLTYRGAVLSLKRYRLRPASSCPDIISVATADDKSTHEWKAVLSDVYFWLKGIFAWENLTNTRFLLFIMSNFLLYMWYDIPYVFLPESVTENGYTKTQASLLGSTFGLSNVVGNIFLGYIGDKSWANSIVVYGVCISICGCVTALMPYFVTVNYYSLSTVCGLFGVMIAANYALTPIILVKVVSLERFASAYGLLLLVQGVGNLVGPPIAGLLYDWTGTWLWSFLVAGGGIFVSNFFILAPIYKRSGEEDERSQSSVGREDC